jgi:hypothetical protein
LLGVACHFVDMRLDVVTGHAGENQLAKPIHSTPGGRVLMRLSEGSPHAGCIFFEVANEAEINGINGAGQYGDNSQVVPMPGRGLVDRMVGSRM